MLCVLTNHTNKFKAWQQVTSFPILHLSSHLITSLICITIYSLQSYYFKLICVYDTDLCTERFLHQCKHTTLIVFLQDICSRDVICRASLCKKPASKNLKDLSAPSSHLPARNLLPSPLFLEYNLLHIHNHSQLFVPTISQGLYSRILTITNETISNNFLASFFIQPLFLHYLLPEKYLNLL